MDILSNLSALNLIQKNLCFMPSGLSQTGNLQLSSELILVVDVIIKKVIWSSSMF